MEEKIEKVRITVSSKGQIVIPKKVRKRFGIEKNSKIELILTRNFILLKPLPKDPFEDLLNLSEKLKLSESEIQKLLQETKKGWEK